MSAGEIFKQGFAMLMQQFGGPVVVHRDGNSVKYRGLKNNEKGKLSKVMFQFSERVDVRVGDVLQQEGARDSWEVYEIEDHLQGDTFVNMNAWVHKKGGMIGRQNATAPNIHIGGDNIGGIQIAGPKSEQAISVTVSVVHSEIAALKRIAAEASDIQPIDKEEISAALDRIEELSKREKSKSVLQRIKDKLDLVKVTMDVSEKAAAAAPYIAAILEKLMNA